MLTVVLMITAKQYKRKVMPLIKSKIILFINYCKYRVGNEILRNNNHMVVQYGNFRFQAGCSTSVLN